MGMIKVPRSEIIELLGLPADVDDVTLQAAMDAAVARQKAVEAASAEEQRLRAEDRRLVNAAYNDGRILNRETWIGHLAASRAVNRPLLASLAPGLRPDEQIVVDEGLEQTHRAVMARLGIQSATPAKPSSPRTVAAASYQAPPPASGPVVDGLGIPIQPVPAPVRLVNGKDPATWSQQERDDAVLWALGPAFRGRIKPPPGGEGMYQPSPNDHFQAVEGANGLAEFRPKSDYTGSV